MMKSSNRAFQNTLPKVEIHHQDKITITNPSCFQGEEILEKKKHRPEVICKEPTS